MKHEDIKVKRSWGKPQCMRNSTGEKPRSPQSRSGRCDGAETSSLCGESSTARAVHFIDWAIPAQCSRMRGVRSAVA
jgi:hypothetical protein